MKKKSRFHKGSIDGLKAWGIARLLEVKEAGSSSRGSSKDKQVTISTRLLSMIAIDTASKQHQCCSIDVFFLLLHHHCCQAACMIMLWSFVNDVAPMVGSKPVVSPSSPPSRESCNTMDPFSPTSLHHLHPQDAKPSKIKVQRFYRPEDISKDQAYKANFWDVYATPKETSNNCHWVQWIDMGDVVKKCAAKAEGTKTPEGRHPCKRCKARSSIWATWTCAATSVVAICFCHMLFMLLTRL